MHLSHYFLNAEKDNYPNVARLFRAISHAEFIHTGDHYRELKHLKDGFTANSMGAFGPGNTLKNLGLAIAGETFEIEEMYPAHMAVAEFQEEKSAYRSFKWSYKTEKMHKALFEKGKAAVAGDKDVELGPVQVCGVCGYTLEGAAPDNCPVCTAPKNKFAAFT